MNYVFNEILSNTLYFLINIKTLSYYIKGVITTSIEFLEFHKLIIELLTFFRIKGTSLVIMNVNSFFQNCFKQSYVIFTIIFMLLSICAS